MPQFLELEPGQLDGSWYRSKTAEDVVYDTYTSSMKLAIGEMVLRPDFSAAAVPLRMLEVVEVVTPTVIKDIFEYEEKYGFSDAFRPLHQRLGRLAITKDNVPELQVSDNFVEDIRRQIDELPYDFSILETWRDMLGETKYLDLARAVHDLSETGQPGWQDDAYRLVEEATQHPKEYTLPLDQQDAIQLVLFLPGYARSLTRRVIAHNTLVANISDRLGPDLDEGEQEVINALRQFLATDALTGAFDTKFRKGLSEDINSELGLLAVQGLDELGTIRALLDSGRGLRVIDAWKDAKESLSNRVSEAASTIPVRYWALIDGGHGFQHFAPHELYSVFTLTEGFHRREFGKAPKDGSRALILEDDERQMSAWQRLVEKHTAAKLDSELCFTEPAGVEDYAEDPSISLFLLDIKNGDDTLAGIKVASIVLAKRAKILAAVREEERQAMPKTEIILWTSSAELAEKADEYFRPVMDALDEELGIAFGYSLYGNGGHGSTANVLSMSIMMKDWHHMHVPARSS